MRIVPRRALVPTMSSTQTQSPGTSFADSGVTAETYYYMTTAIGEEGVESLTWRPSRFRRLLKTHEAPLWRVAGVKLRCSREQGFISL